MFTFIRSCINRYNDFKNYEWRWVPPPNWACKRNGVHYW